MRLFYCSLCGVNVLIKDTALAERVTSGEEAVVCDRCVNSKVRKPGSGPNSTLSKMRSNANMPRVRSARSNANLPQIRSSANLPAVGEQSAANPQVPPAGIPANGSSGVMPRISTGFLTDSGHPEMSPEAPLETLDPVSEGLMPPAKSGLMPTVGSGILPKVGSISGMNLPRLGSNTRMPRAGSQTGHNLPRVGSKTGHNLPRIGSQTGHNLPRIGSNSHLPRVNRSGSYLGLSTSNPRNPRVTPAVAAERAENDQIQIGIIIFTVMVLIVVGLVVANSGSPPPQARASEKAVDKRPAPAVVLPSTTLSFSEQQIERKKEQERELARERKRLEELSRVAVAPTTGAPIEEPAPGVSAGPPAKPAIKPAKIEGARKPDDRETRAPNGVPEEAELPGKPAAPEVEVRKYPPLLGERTGPLTSDPAVDKAVGGTRPKAIVAGKPVEPAGLLTVEPGVPVVQKPAYELEYERVTLEFLTALSQRDFKGALKRYSDASADPSFAPLKATIALDTQLLTQIENVREVVARGAKTFTAKRSFTVGTRTGKDLVIGEGSSNSFSSIDNEGINYEQALGAGKAELKLRFDALSPTSQRNFIELGLGTTKAPLLMACAEAFVLQAEDSAEALAENLEAASKDPATQGAAKRLTALLDLQRKDTAAQTAFRTIEALVRGKRWEPARASISSYNKNFGGTYALARVEKQLEKHRKLVEKELNFTAMEGEQPRK